MDLKIGIVDLLVIVLYVVACVSLGLWVGRGQRNLTDYMLGGRSLPWWSLLGSIIATETSAVTFLSVPGEAFNPNGGDLRFLQLPLGYIVGRCLVVVLLLPQYFRGELFSAYEVLSRRFGGSVRKVASLLFLVTRTFADGLRLFLTAVVLNKVSGIDMTACVVVVGVITIGYTSFGGMKSVVWTDCLQFVTYLVGAAVAAAMILYQLPHGWSDFTSYAAEYHKLRMFDFSFDLTEKYTFWAGLIGGAFLALATHGADQLMVQRYLSARDQREAGRALALSGVFVFLQFALFLLIGIELACFYHLNPPDKPFARNDEVFIAFIVDHLPVGLSGLVLAAIFAAAMSSSLNSSASALMDDLFLPMLRREISEKEKLWWGRLFTAMFGVAQIGAALFGEHVKQSVVSSVLSIAGFTTGITLGVFFLGIFVRRATSQSALIGLLAGLGVVSYVAFGTRIAWPWYTIIGSSTTFLVGLAASLVLRPREPENAE